MNKLLLISALLIGLCSNAQVEKEFTKYYDYVGINNSGKGNVKMTGKVDKNGFIVGEAKHYLKDGTLQYIINHTTNISKEFYSTGELKNKGSFNPDTGEHLGIWITYNKKGEVLSKEDFSKQKHH